MPKLRHLAALAAASTALCAATSAVAAPVTVNLRVEGSTATLFEGPITTDAKTIDNNGSGPQPCDGTNGGANPTPGPSATGALDDASLTGAFTWTGSWDAGYQDFFVTRVGPTDDSNAAGSTHYWALLRNWQYTPDGGCHTRVQSGDDVLWAWTDYSEPLLQLTAPARAATGEPIAVTVQANDGSGSRTPAPAASVDGATTDANGQATISFADQGEYTFKATRAGSVRSNAVTVCVYVPGSGDCGTDKSQPTDGSQPDTTPAPAPATKDTTPPVVHVISPLAGKTYGNGPRLLSGTIDETGGIAQVFLRLRATDGGNLTSASRCRWFSGKRGVFTHRTVPCSKARFFRVGSDTRFSYLLPARLRTGKYVLDVKVLDRAYNAGRSSVPFGVK